MASLKLTKKIILYVQSLVRLVVALIFLSKWLVGILNPLIGTISNSHNKNNTDLIDRLNDVSVPYEFKLVSFDVTSLFTKVPLFDLLNFLSHEFDNCKIPVNKTDLITPIKLCTLDNKFKFGNYFFMQKFGLAMGGPASPTLSNLYMEFFEKYELSKILPPDVPWFRYVDDVLCLWPRDRPLAPFIEQLNGLVPSINPLTPRRTLVAPFTKISILF